jgi:hypothetical protein
MYETVRRLPIQPTSISSRYVWLTAADWTKFATLLCESFPEARYFAEPSSTSTQGRPRPPSIRFHDDILSTDGYSKRDHAMIVFSPDWVPVYVKYTGILTQTISIGFTRIMPAQKQWHDSGRR